MRAFGFFRNRIGQVIASVAYNGALVSVIKGSPVYSGPLKGACVPGLHCYGCPLSPFSCPMGALQHFVVGYRLNGVAGVMDVLRGFPFYIIGLLGVVGLAVGRMACGWACPFGFLQDLLFKIRTVKLRMPSWLRYGKYVMLFGVAVGVVYLFSDTWFCKLCPAGFLEAGAPLGIWNPGGDIRAGIGLLYWVKLSILVGFVGAVIFIKRFFCRTLCPLGAIYSLFNKVSMLRLRVDRTVCTRDCGVCHKVCPTDLYVRQFERNADCIMCLECARRCPRKAIRFTAA